MAKRWAATSWSEDHVRHIDGFHVIFEEVHGGTHILSDVSFEILKILADTPLDLVGLERALSEKFTLDADEELIDVLNARVSELDDLGLLKAVL